MIRLLTCCEDKWNPILTHQIYGQLMSENANVYQGISTETPMFGFRKQPGKDGKGLGIGAYLESDITAV